MKRIAALGLALFAGACTSIAAPPPREVAIAPALPASAKTWSEAQAAQMLREIDPLGGSWRLVAFDGPPVAANRNGLLFGHEGAFLSTSGDCTSSQSEYVREGARLDILRHIPPETGKCDDAATASLDRALAHVVAAARLWSIDAAGQLHLDPAQGRGAVFKRPVPRWPTLNGRWVVETIGGKPAVGAFEFSDTFVSGSAGCNSAGGQAAITADTIVVTDQTQTLIGCGPEREGADGLLFGALGGRLKWSIAPDGRLHLVGATELAARRPAAQVFSLSGRYQVCNSSTLPFISHDGETWLDFTADSVRDQAGCRARYETSGSQLRLSLGEETACKTPALPPRGAFEIGGQRSLLAKFRPTGFAWDRDGRLRLSTPRGLLALCRYTPEG